MESGVVAGDQTGTWNSVCCHVGTISLLGFGCGHDVESPGPFFLDPHLSIIPDSSVQMSLSVWQTLSQSVVPIGIAAHIQRKWDIAFILLSAKLT